MKRWSAALALPRPAEPPRDLAALRRRLASGSDRDAVVLDFLEDDLAQARCGLGEVSRHLAEVEAALGDPGATRHRILELALGPGAEEQLEQLAGALESLRRRLVQVSARLGPSP